MHVICNDCFKKAGPLEELTIGIIQGSSTCLYCQKKLEGEDHRKGHRLAGDTPHFSICRALGLPTNRCSYFDFIDQNRDLDVEFEQELQKDPKAMADRAIQWLRDQNEYGKARLARLIEVLKG